jgi:hypothetical protein
MTTMAMDPMTEGYLAAIPGELVVRAQQDMDFALRLLHQESRDDAVSEAGIELTDEQKNTLYVSLDKIANMSFQDALESLRHDGVVFFM